MTTHQEAIVQLVTADADDDYEGSGINDKKLGHYYHLKQYEKAIEKELNFIKKDIEVPKAGEQQEFANDGKFAAFVQPRAGRRTLDKERLQNDLITAFTETGMHVLYAQKLVAGLIGRCYKYSNPSYALSVVRSADK